MPSDVDKEYAAALQESIIAYGLEPGVPRPDVTLCNTAFQAAPIIAVPPEPPVRVMPDGQKVPLSR